MSIQAAPDVVGSLTVMAECCSCGGPQTQGNPIRHSDYGGAYAPIGTPAAPDEAGIEGKIEGPGTDAAYSPLRGVPGMGR